MSRTRPWFVVLAVAAGLWACGCDDDPAVDDDDTGDDDSAADDDDDSLPTEAQVEDVTWRLHDHIETLIFVNWTQLVETTASVEYTFENEEWHRSPPRETGAGEQEQILLGIPYGMDVRFRIVNDWGAGPTVTEEHQAQTGDHPEGLPLPSLLVSDPAAYDPAGRFLVSSINAFDGGWTGGDYWKFILDRQGRMVWAMLTPDNDWTTFMRVSADGDDLLWDASTFWSDLDMGAGSRVHRMKIDGTIVESYDTPGLHHAFTELPDETLVWGSATWWNEVLVKLEPGGEVEAIWDCGEFHDSLGVLQQCQSNTVYWNEATDSFLYCSYTTNTVVEVDHQTGAAMRWWGQLPYAWGFEPIESTFWWQHGAHITGDGTLLVSTYAASGDTELVAREYEIDEDDEVLRQVWSFGEGEGVEGDTAGEAHRLPSGNTLHNYGEGCRMREVTPDGDVVWDVDWVGTKLQGRSVFVEDLYAFEP